MWDPANLDWDGGGSGLARENLAFANGAGLEFRVLYADLGLPPASPVAVQFYATGYPVPYPLAPGAHDTLPSEPPPIAWAAPTTHTVLALAGPVASFSQAAYTSLETAGAVPITVTLGLAAPITITVPYTVAPGTAGPADFTPDSGLLQFPPGITQTTFLVAVTPDELSEPPETVRLQLGPTVSGFAFTPPPATLTLVDDARRLYLPSLMR
jgi:hypothetical protein